MTKPLPREPKKSSVGEVYGLITIVGESTLRGKSNRAMMVVGKCQCGKQKLFPYFQLKNGHTKSCGCTRSICKLQHGLKKNLSYNIWTSLRSKARNGLIKMDDDWVNSIESFLKGVGERPSIDHRLSLYVDRKGYVEDNTYWEWKPGRRPKGTEEDIPSESEAESLRQEKIRAREADISKSEGELQEALLNASAPGRCPEDSTADPGILDRND